MQTVHTSPAFSLTAHRAADLEADVLLVAAFEGDDLASHAGLDQATGQALSRALASGELKAKPYDVFVTSIVADGWKAPRLIVVGVGRRRDFTADVLRRAVTTGALAARHRRATTLAIACEPLPGLSPERAVQAIAEGVCLANYDGRSYKTDPEPRTWIVSATVGIDGDAGQLGRALERGRLLGDYTNRARALSNAPGNELTPRVFAERASAIASEAGLSVEVLDETRIADLKMGLLLGVARGSNEPPRVVVLRYEPAADAAGAAPVANGVVLGLVGKGITFDTGGISIKPADNMDKMKDDMSGGAAVVCAMAAMAALRAPVRCIGVIPMSENMPNGRAVKPGDVLTSAEGKTVEVLNTDAEGRLILGDGLWYARQLGATHLIDIATLTGACVVALGKTTSGLFGTPPAWVEQVRAASERAGDRSWPMPVFDDYKEQLKSDIADFTNTGGRAGGAITGALFIKEFAGDLPWVHIDIAGTAWAEDAKPYQPKGATGAGVRTLIELALDAATWSKLNLTS
jgi:leucyl aminopeptidase